jgi:transposase
MDTSQAVVPANRNKQRRQLRTNSEKRRIVEEALRGDESVAAVARRHGINANLLFNWRKLYQQGLLEQCREPASATLVPVKVTPARPKPAVRPEKPSTITIELSGEVCLRLEGRVDPEALADVLSVLGAR